MLRGPALIVLTGASGAGKSTVGNHLALECGFTRVITCTTRAPRPGEVHGVHYIFLTIDEYATELKNGNMILPGYFNENHYGTRRSDLEGLLAAGKDVVLLLERQGALDIRDIYKETKIFYLGAPIELMHKRAIERGTPKEEVLRRHKSEPPLSKNEAWKEGFIYLDTTEANIPAVARLILECLVG